MATELKDFLLDADNELVIQNGDFVIGVAEKQYVDHIIRSSKGHFKEDLFVGVGIDNYTNSTGKDQELKREIKVQLEKDGYKVLEVAVSRTVEGELNIQPYAERI